MSAIELQQLLVTRSAALAIIFITADTDDNIRIQALRSGAAGSFYKPFERKAARFLGKLTRCLSRMDDPTEGHVAS
jgi:FixJ family two-component response regulator